MDDPIEIRWNGNSSAFGHQSGRRWNEAETGVSAGNTGALMAIARYVLKTMEVIVQYH
jgi:fatty acid/phospholipid biosynthesis enzyme